MFLLVDQEESTDPIAVPCITMQDRLPQKSRTQKSGRFLRILHGIYVKHVLIQFLDEIAVALVLLHSSDQLGHKDKQ